MSAHNWSFVDEKIRLLVHLQIHATPPHPPLAKDQQSVSRQNLDRVKSAGAVVYWRGSEVTGRLPSSSPEGNLAALILVF